MAGRCQAPAAPTGHCPEPGAWLGDGAASRTVLSRTEAGCTEHSSLHALSGRLTCSAARSRARTRAPPSRCRTWGWWSTERSICHRRSGRRPCSGAVTRDMGQLRQPAGEGPRLRTHSAQRHQPHSGQPGWPPRLQWGKGGQGPGETGTPWPSAAAATYGEDFQVTRFTETVRDTDTVRELR